MSKTLQWPKVTLAFLNTRESVGRGLTSFSTSVMLCLVAQSYPTLCNPMDCSLPGSSVHGDSLGKNARVGCHALLQGIFPTQGSNPDLSHCRQIQISRTAGRFCTIWATREAPCYHLTCAKCCGKVSHSVVPSSLQLCSPWNSPGQNTGVGSLSLLQGIFPTQGSNPGLSHCKPLTSFSPFNSQDKWHGYFHPL